MAAEPAKILILENELHMGGLEKGLVDLARCINRERYRLVVCCLKDGGFFKKDFVAAGVPFHDRLMQNRYDAAALWRVADIAKNERIDLLYTIPHANTLIFAALLKRIAAIRRVVVSVHATGGPDGGRMLPRYVTPFFRSVDAFIALAQPHREYLTEKESIPSKKITIIHDGVDLEHYAPGTAPAVRAALSIPADAPVVVNVATLKPLKRLDLLIRAVALLRERHPGVRLLLIGDGSERQSLEALAREQGLGDRVVFTGIREDVNELLRAADIFALSSRTEALPNVILEAMATALPVVTTDVGSVRELVDPGENGVIVPPNDAYALAEEISALLSDPERARRLGQRGRAIAEARFPRANMIREREQLFDRLLGKA